ncbi:elongation factor G, mitochondrial [Phellopilus nigrolimitatus]|nr:elongation factor G, mitochondrial [Phellopilus nigrolimitatus]
MDHLELERENGNTIQSAATFCDWEATEPTTGEKKSYALNIIDTPGHVDFTIEVEYALWVLDGAILILCAVAGVQSQTTTVDRQMRRYNVPRISFINKMDRPGANPWHVIQQIRSKLRISAAAVQVPIGAEDQLRGVGVKGNDVVESDEIPADALALAQEKRTELIETLADVDDGMAELFLEEKPPTTEQLVAAIRRATVGLRFSPVFLGSAIKNTAVQPLLDGVCAYPPNPAKTRMVAHDVTLPLSAPPVALVPAAEAPLVALAFKPEESRFEQLTYMRVYQGSLKKAQHIFHTRTGKKVKEPRLVRMHSNEMEDIESIGPGEICAIFGVECASGDTFTDGATKYLMTFMFVPEPVVSLALKPRFQREDPTFRVHIDHESKGTILHLEVYVERMRRKYGVECTTGCPQVAYRETPTRRCEFVYTHRKQTGGAGQFARIAGYFKLMERDPETGRDTEFENVVMSRNVPEQYIPGIEKGFKEAILKGSLCGAPTTGIRFVLKDGAFHVVDSSELAFRVCMIAALRENYAKTQPVILEPIMTVEVVVPFEFQSSVIGGVTSRRGTILDSEVHDDEFKVTAEVALNDMSGYSSQLRGQTQGKGEFTMEYKTHVHVLPQKQKELEEAYRKTRPQKK